MKRSVVLFVLFAIAVAGAVWMPEPVVDRSRPRLTPQRPRVPPSARRAFLLAGLGVTSSWSIGVIVVIAAPPGGDLLAARSEAGRTARPLGR